MPIRLQEPTFWILTALAGGRRHGYALLDEVKELTDDRVDLKVTTLYAALERLQQEGLIALDGEETVEGRRRRYFTLTADGARMLAEESQRLTRAGRRASARLRAHGWAPTPAAGA